MRLAAGLLLFLTACSTSVLPAPTQPAPAVPQPLRPYATGTPTLTPLPAAAATATPLPPPSPTPRTHTVARGEDLGGIAYRYGMTLADLLAANPQVNPYAMSIGTVLVIPTGSEASAPEAAALPAPQAVRLDRVACTRSRDGGAWCFALVHNDGEQGLESISARVFIADQNGEQRREATASLPLDLLAPGAQLPLAAYFAAPVPAQLQAGAELLSALPQPADDSRYLPAVVTGITVTIQPDGTAARVRGQVQLDSPDAVPGQVWLAAAAYDAAGQVVGVRRYENGSSLTFDFYVYSAAGQISRVDVLPQVRP